MYDEKNTSISDHVLSPVVVHTLALVSKSDPVPDTVQGNAYHWEIRLQPNTGCSKTVLILLEFCRTALGKSVKV